MTQEATTRRDRLRAATIEEITATARRLLIEQGPEAVSLRAIAREMGMTAPALYRYYDSHEDLLRHVVAGIFRELSRDLRRAIDEADPLPHNLHPAGSAGQRRHLTFKVVAACREFRRWALSQRAEFTLLFGVPVPGLSKGDEFDVAEQCALEFTATFYTLFMELWEAFPFPVPDPSEIEPGLLAQLQRFRKLLNTPAPEGTVLTFLRCWVILYGGVSMEVFGHLEFALDEPSPMFEYTLADLGRLVGLEYPLPAES